MKNKENGQALVFLLFFMIFAITVTSAAVIVITTNSLAQSKFTQGNDAYFVAESGAENALIRLLRNPGYQGETLTVGGGTANITVTGTNPVTITSTGNLNNFSRKIQVTANYTNDILSVTSWKEI